MINDINVTGDIGGSIDAETTFEVADTSYLAEFTKVFTLHSHVAITISDRYRLCLPLNRSTGIFQQIT